LRPTSHTNPIYVEENVVHFGVPNMPGAVPWTATQALNNSTLPYVLKLANHGLGALKIDLTLGKGLNVQNHRIVHLRYKKFFLIW
jgi:alanine dehydrogenase